MLTFHLGRIALPRLAVVAAAAAAMLWIGFRPGGTEVGYEFGVWGIARFWVVMTPIVIVLLVPMLGRLWQIQRLLDSWALSRPSTLRAIADSLFTFWAGFLVYLAFTAILAAFAATQVKHIPAVYDNLAIMTLTGPILGGYWTLAAAYAAGLRYRSAALRIGIVAFIAVVDATNQLPFTVTSLSGTSAMTSKHGAWQPNLFDAQDSEVVRPTVSFLVARLALCVISTLAVMLQARRLNRSLNEAL
jgi:hypothetical protein